MDDGGPTASIIIFVGLLLVNMLFYGFGAAIQCLNRKEVEKRAENKKKASERLLKIMEKPERYVNTVQFVVTLINLIVGWFYLRMWLEFVRNAAAKVTFLPVRAIGVVSLCITMLFLVYVLLTFGILIPKRIASKYPVHWAYACIHPVHYITWLLRPLTGLTGITSKLILGVFGIREGDEPQDVTEEEIISMVNEGHEQGIFQAGEAEMISNIFEYGEKEAKDIMIHRKSIMALESSTPLQDAVQFMLEERNSRYPVYEENIDHIIGILYMKDAMRALSAGDNRNSALKETKDLLRDAAFIPETRKIDVLFQMMQSQKTQMAIVVDEYGQTSGLVTMEDILEEIVGNILDEYDEEEEHIEEKGNNEYLIEGMTPLEELEERFGIDFEEEELETLNGYLISKMQRIPEEGEDFSIVIGEYHFKVISVENKMIQTVLVTKQDNLE